MALLPLFEALDTGVLIDASHPSLEAVLAQLPMEADEYVRLAEESFGYLSEEPSESSELEFERLVRILRFLLEVDGRSEEALLRIAELARDDPSKSFAGVNALAGLVGYYRVGGPSARSTVELRRFFEELMANEELFHNARECRNAILEREGVR